MSTHLTSLPLLVINSSIQINFTAEGAENGLEFTIVRPFNWIGPRMDFIPGIDGPSEGVPRVLACFSNVSSNSFLVSKLITELGRAIELMWLLV